MKSKNSPGNDAPKRRRREHLHVVFYKRPRCPICGVLAPPATRSLANGDGSVTRTVNCKICGLHFLVVAE